MKHLYINITAVLVAASVPLSLGKGHPTPGCVTDKLEKRQRLYRNQYVCAENGDKIYRIGLDSNGMLAQYENDNLEWTSGKKGTYLLMKSSGILVLRADDGKEVWSNECYAPGAYLSFHPMYPVSILLECC